jgi:rfaE bifunctional protein nucleotidyltransferase chain/domain
MRGPLVVVGDTLLDVDLEGVAERLAPDSPVPVLDDLVEHERPGGAGLAAAMAALDGHEVVLVTALGDDEAGRRVEALLEGVRVLRLPYDGPTPVKKRVRAGGQSLLRLDSGTRPGSVHELTDAAREEVAGVLAEAAAVLVADYGRGVTGVPALRALLEQLPKRVPLVWDPHPRGAVPVRGARLVTPNRAEAALFAERQGIPTTTPVRTVLAEVGPRAAGLVAAWEVQAVAVTLGAGGALLSYGDGSPAVSPAPSVHCVDPCGAGDRFAVSAAVGLGSGRVTVEAVHEAVLDAADYVAAGGPASLSSLGRAGADGWSAKRRPPAGRPSPGARRPVEELVASVSRQGGTVVATGGCFDLLHAGHVATLRAARGLGDCLVVCLNSDDSVRRLKGPSRPLVPAADRARVLEALECVDAVVVFDEDTPVEVLHRVRPDIWAKGGDYAGADVPEGAVLQAWGGQAVVLPYLQGRSTTQLVHSASERAARADQSDHQPIHQPNHQKETSG